MGEAKKRGTREERIKQSIKRNNDLLKKYKPEGLICNSCNCNIESIKVCDVSDMEELEFVCCGHCEKCDSTSWGMVGDEEAIALLGQYMEQQSGEKPISTVESIKLPKLFNK